MRLALGCLIVLAAALPAVAGEPPGAYYENAAWGYKIRVPKDWREVQAPAPYVASKHLGKRELEAQRGSEYWTRETPEMWVVGFPKAKGEVENPNRDWGEYIRTSDFVAFEDGYKVAEEKETTVDGAKVTTYELTQEPQTGCPHRIVAWVYHYDDFDLAVQFKVLEWHYADYDSSFRGCLKSFRRIERTKAIGGSAAGGEGGIRTRDDLLALPPEKRARALKDAVEVQCRREVDALPDGWKDKRTKQFLVLYSAEEKFVKATLLHAGAVADHLEDIFGPAGQDYVPPAILRIFSDDEAESAYRQGKPDTETLLQEIDISAGHGWEKDNAWEELNRSLLTQWLNTRHPELEGTLPEWLKTGLKKYMEMVRTKGRRIGYANDDWDRDEIRLQIKKEKYESLLTLLSREITNEGRPNAMLEGYDRERQQRVVVLWLMREGNRGKYKNLIRNLVLNLALEIERVEEEWAQANPKAKEAADYALQKHGAVASKRAEILKNAWNATFPGWDAKDWDRLTTAWLSHAK